MLYKLIAANWSEELNNDLARYSATDSFRAYNELRHEETGDEVFQEKALAAHKKLTRYAKILKLKCMTVLRDQGVELRNSQLDPIVFCNGLLFFQATTKLEVVK